jgi:hypothetical protein
MRSLALLSLLVLSAPASARRKKGAQPVVQKVPSIDEVVAKEGFVPTPSQSETYRPGVVLVPNAQGGHDEVHPDCIGVEPSIKIMSQSSIATSLSAGVSARLAAARGQVAAGVEKRLSFVDPEQRTIPFSSLNPTEECSAGLETAARFTDLSQAILVYDVLVAQIQNTVCTRADASGSVIVLVQRESDSGGSEVTTRDGFGGSMSGWLSGDGLGAYPCGRAGGSAGLCSALSRGLQLLVPCGPDGLLAAVEAVCGGDVGEG